MRLPIDYSDFAELVIRKFDFVDKTLLIKALIDSEANSGEKVTLITRPRRFGKTLNLSMIKSFFEVPKPSEPAQNLFENLKISQAGADYLQHQSQYPVILITFKDMKESKYEDAHERFKKIISDMYAEHRYLLSGTTLYENEKKIYEAILNQTATLTQTSDSLKDLTKYLFRYYQQKVIILIDEYDTPLQAGYLKVVQSEQSRHGAVCELAIPNLEIRALAHEITYL